MDFPLILNSPRKYVSLQQHLAFICFSFTDIKGLCKIALPLQLYRWGSEAQAIEDVTSRAKSKLAQVYSAGPCIFQMMNT